SRLRPNMPLNFASGFRALGVAVALALATAPAAEPKPSSPLIGATREQVLAQFGEPKSHIVAGNREVLFFDHDRITLRDNVVIETEKISVEPVRRPPAAGASDATPTPAAAQPGPAANPAAPVAPNAPTPVPSATTVVETTPASANAAPATAAASTPTPVDPNAPLEIKPVRPGSVPRPAPPPPRTVAATAAPANPPPAAPPPTAPPPALPT